MSIPTLFLYLRKHLVVTLQRIQDHELHDLCNLKFQSSLWACSVALWLYGPVYAEPGVGIAIASVFTQTRLMQVDTC